MSRDDALITYIPADAVAKLEEPSVIISIKGKHNDRPAIDPKHTVFHLDFDVGDWARECDAGLKTEQIDALLKFVESVKPRDIFIHCTEGKCRSYTIAKLLRSRYRDEYYLDHHKLSDSGQWLDRHTCNTWNNYMESIDMQMLRAANMPL